MWGFPEVIAMVIPFFMFLISLGVAIYVLLLLTRLVRAVEKIAEHVKLP